MFYYGKILEKAQSMDNWTDKIWAVLKGPGWFPGTDRLGDPMGVPEVKKHLIIKINLMPPMLKYSCLKLFMTIFFVGGLLDTTPGEI